MRVGDLVRCKHDSLTFMSGLDSGVGIITHIEKYEKSPGLSYCVQWAEDFLWYESDELELVSESR